MNTTLISWMPGKDKKNASAFFKRVMWIILARLPGKHASSDPKIHPHENKQFYSSEKKPNKPKPEPKQLKKRNQKPQHSLWSSQWVHLHKVSTFLKPQMDIGNPQCNADEQKGVKECVCMYVLLASLFWKRRRVFSLEFQYCYSV